MGQHYVQAWLELLPGPPDRVFVLQAQDKVTAGVIGVIIGSKCFGLWVGFRCVG